MLSVVDVAELLEADVDKTVTLNEGDAVMLHCPFYQPSVPVAISWLYPDRDYLPVTIDQTTAVTDNGIIRHRTIIIIITIIINN